ncbi:alpha/beta fold hydrolase [Pseudooceanicola sp. C21-150M6]|uniref:alpha/beta fold hydrolase n=1 Tax=Pseudooceanicola sp. C21-150M6 TaxID=3434355 RepID=UPI003D7F5AF6
MTQPPLRLAHEQFGLEGAPVILLISGLATQMIRWTDHFCAGLAARGYRVIRFDNRDAGLSPHLDGAPAPPLDALIEELRQGRIPKLPYALPDMAADVVALMEELGIAKAHVVGRSMGGMIAQIMACRYPDRILTLTSIMSGTGNPHLPGPAPEVMALMAGPRPDPATDPEDYMERSLAFARRIAGQGAPFDAVEQRGFIAEERRRAHDPAGGARQLAAMATAGDRRVALAALSLPALVIHGTDDPLILPVHGQDTAEVIPGAELLMIDGMGHDIPAAFATAIIDAIDRMTRRAMRSI